MKQTKRAFSVIEVLVVMVLIGVLSALGGIYYHRMNQRGIALKAREDASNIANIINNLYKSGTTDGQLNWPNKGAYPNYDDFNSSDPSSIGRKISLHYFKDTTTIIQPLNAATLNLYQNSPKSAVDAHSKETIFYYPIYRHIDTTNDCKDQTDCNEIQLYYIDNDGINYSFKLAKKAASGVLINE